MAKRGTTTVKLKMSPYFWRLLGKYCVVLSVRAKAREGQRMSLTKTVTGIVATHLARHSKWIEDEFKLIVQEVSLAQASGFPVDYIDAIASADSAQISDVVRAGTSPKRLTNLLKGFRALLQSGGSTGDHARRPAQKPRKVRGAGIGLGDAAVAHIGPPETTGLDPERNADPGPGNAGPQPELLQRAAQATRKGESTTCTSNSTGAAGGKTAAGPHPQ